MIQSETERNPWHTWRSAARCVAVDEALQMVYGEIAEAVGQRGAQCWLSGRCCHFEAFGHKLYVTGLEVAWVLQRAGKPSRSIVAGEACPYQAMKQCTVHASRPMGCRIFFCQEGTESWQHALYERKLKGLRALHDRFEIDYRYMEWLSGLNEAMDSGEFQSIPNQIVKPKTEG